MVGFISNETCSPTHFHPVLVSGTYLIAFVYKKFFLGIDRFFILLEMCGTIFIALDFSKGCSKILSDTSGCSSMVEHRPSKPRAAGSNPVARSSARSSIG